jgi:hypothetical protein
VVLGPQHPYTLITRYELARWTGGGGDPAAARDLFARLLPAFERILDPAAPVHPWSPAPTSPAGLGRRTASLARRVIASACSLAPGSQDSQPTSGA